MSDHIRLDEVLSDRQIREVNSEADTLEDCVRACIRLALEKAEKVEGWAFQERIADFGKNHQVILWHSEASRADLHEPVRHAILLLGPKYEPKPVRSAEERIQEIEQRHRDFHDIGGPCRSDYPWCTAVRILRGESE